MKFFILAILAGSLIAVSPSAVGQHYDDALHNNMSPAMRRAETDADQFSTQPIIVPLARSQIMNLCRKNMNKKDFMETRDVISKTIEIAKQAESHGSYHTFVASMNHVNGEARTYELTIVRKETAMVGILTKKTHEIETKNFNEFYYEIYSSDFGLPFQFIEKTPIERLNLTQDVADFMRQYLLRAAEQHR